MPSGSIYLLFDDTRKEFLGTHLQKLCTLNSDRSYYSRGLVQFLVISSAILQCTLLGAWVYFSGLFLEIKIRLQHVVQFGSPEQLLEIANISISI